MGLGGQHTQFLNEWNTFTVDDQFAANPCQSGFALSGVPQPPLWLPGPNTATGVQCSGVTFQTQSGIVFGGALLNAPATAGAEGQVFTKENFACVSGGSLYAKARLTPVEITSGGLGFFFGFASNPGSSGLTLSTGGVRQSGVMFGLLKQSGQNQMSLTFNALGSGKTLQATNALVGGPNSGIAQDFEIFVNPDRGSMQLTAKVNGVPLKTNYTDLFPMVLTAPTDSTPMGVGFAVRQGVSEADGLLVDKVHAQQGHNYP